MKHKPMVSVIIVSYNFKDSIDKAIRSVREQTWPDIEIIIGDDGSTDGSIPYLKEKCKDEGYYFFTMDREGETFIPSIRASNIIKKGLSVANGSYIAVLSGDDYFCDPAKIERAVNYLRRHSETFAYVSGFRYESDKTVIRKVAFPQMTRNTYLSGLYLHISCFVFRKFETFLLLDRMCDDCGLQYTLACLGKWRFEKQITFSYCQRNTGITRSSDKIALDILELMMLQDAVNKKSIMNKVSAMYSRAAIPIWRLFLTRKRWIGRAKYKKYVSNCNDSGGFDVLGLIARFDNAPFSQRIRLLYLLLRASLMRMLYLPAQLYEVLMRRAMDRIPD